MCTCAFVFMIIYVCQNPECAEKLPCRNTLGRHTDCQRALSDHSTFEHGLSCRWHFPRLKCKHLQAFNITLHRETVNTYKINPVFKCLKIIRTSHILFWKRPTVGKYCKEPGKYGMARPSSRILCLKAEGGIISEDCIFFKIHKITPIHDSTK